MIEKLKELKRRFEEVGEDLVNPEIIADMKRYTALNKEYKDLQKIVNVYDQYQLVLDNINSSKDVLKTEKDEEFREMAKMEISELEPQVEPLEDELKQLLIPKDPEDDKNAILEIRAGAGGDESAIFTGDLLRMYQRYCDKKGWKLQITDAVHGTSGGFSKVIANVIGEDVYGILKFESGVHRVQRVPATESQGRVHTSAASVAMLPEVEEFDFDINMGDVRKDTFRASGAGGQHINKTESAVRLTHNPTGMVVECQDGRSQHKNYAAALKELRARLYKIEMDKRNEKVSSHRKSLIGSGDRADKIRTYNYPQSRVTDHRINKTAYNLDAMMDGNIEDFTEALRLADNAEKMQNDNQDIV
ncbi:peptide chain release factor 1 [Cyclobacteriaceae bacterium]|nr:peptide chain release factor 1 [Cyclobacteriaceae bacterium]